MSLLSDISSADVAYRIGWTLLHSLWQCAMVAVVLAVALQALRRHSANARYMVACAGMATMLAGFVATFFFLPSLEEDEVITAAAAVDGQLESMPQSALIEPSVGHPVTITTQYAPQDVEPQRGYPYFWRFVGKDRQGKILSWVGLGDPDPGKNRQDFSTTIRPGCYAVLQHEIPADSVNGLINDVSRVAAGKFQIGAIFRSAPGPDGAGWAGELSASTDAVLTRTPWGPEVGGLRTRLRLNKRRYRVGQGVHIAVDLVNTTDRIIKFSLPAEVEPGIVKMLVDKGASVSAGKARGCTPLLVAVREGWVEVAAWLIEHGSPLNVENQRGQSLLHIAVQHRRAAAMVTLLAAKGMKVNQRDRDGRSPLHFSVNVEAAAALLAAGADPNARDKWGNTFLYRAIVTRELAMVEFLLDNGARANALITPGRSALDVGVGFPDVAKLLVKRGAASTQPLHEACQRGDLAEVTRLLEKYPAFLNSRPEYDPHTLLHKAAATGNKPIAELLISKGADVDARVRDWTPLHAAMVTRDLTPLHAEIAKGRAEVAALLIAKGATVDVRNRSKETPLHLATRYGTAELVRLLLKNGAKVNAKEAYGQTPLHFAVRRNQKITAKLLIDAGADLDAKTESRPKDWTPLHFGVWYADREMVELLLSAGARVDVPDKGGYTPLDLATRKRRKDGVIELLREAKEVPKTDGQGKSRD